MSELNFFKAVVRVEYTNAKGHTKYRKENYIVEAISPTDVESKIAKRLEGIDYELVGVNLTNIIEIIK